MADAMLAGPYDSKLVALSFVIAFCASYITLELAERSVGSPLHKKNLWIIGAALSIGIGLWGVNNVVLLSLRLPALVSKEFTSPAASLVAAFSCSLLALILVCWRPLQRRYLLGACVVLSGCMSALLYLAIQSLRLGMRPEDPFRLLGFSFLLIVLAAVAAAQLGFRFRHRKVKRLTPGLLSGALMALALFVIQYAAALDTNIEKYPASLARLASTSERMASEILIWVALMLLTVFGLSILIGEAGQVVLSQRRVLRSDRERWRLLMATTQEGLVDFNLLSGEVFYSPRWKEMIGYAANELADTLETWQLRIHPDDRKAVDSAVERYLRSKQGFAEIEYRLKHRDGGWRWIRDRSRAVWNEAGNPVRLVGSHSDVTDRKRASEELAASERRFSAFMQHNPGLAFIKDENGRFVYSNSTLENVWKIKTGDWLGKTNKEIWPEDVAKQFADGEQEIRSTGAWSELIEELQLPDGSTHQFLTSRFSFSDALGKRLLGGFSLDITQRLRTEEVLRNSEDRIHRLFENNPLPSWIYRLCDSQIVDVNQAALDRYGWPRSEFLTLTHDSLPLDAVKLSSHKFDAGGIPQCLVMAQDVSRLGYAELPAAQWRSLLDGLPHIVWLAGADGFCEYISRQMADYTGAAMAQLVGWGWRNFVHPLDRDILRTRWMKAVFSGDKYDAEYRILSKDGAYRWFLTCGRSIQLPDGGNYWLGITRDIEDEGRGRDLAEESALVNWLTEKAHSAQASS